jgi:hypothetical protein
VEYSEFKCVKVITANVVIIPTEAFDLCDPDVTTMDEAAHENAQRHRQLLCHGRSILSG